MTRYALRHLRSGHYIASHPDMGTLQTSPDEGEAVSWPTHTEADLYAIQMLEDFKPMWEVVPVERAMMADHPRSKEGE